MRGAYYKEKSTRVVQPMIDADLDVGDAGQLKGHTLVDAIASASAASGASGDAFTERRVEGGLSYMRHSISDTAEHGDYTGGARIISDATREEMRKMLAEIRNGRYADAWIAENEAGRPWFNERRRSERVHPIEQTGQKLRASMPFLNPVEVTEDGQVKPSVAEPVAATVER